ncbi:hypothetical protein [Arthrobacter antibioticus]|uniref:hypothetical protein n=1 Tax=Arthrobacter sp. H35-MC1 TaxID=3046203 RepID=UPI0024BACAEC|nr:hypothetical protein [Arthrobacter sp. H35-MC1]MDJ0318388.1 hypothetical protein [Arthrobacter sp. H35-MC1]
MNPMIRPTVPSTSLVMWSVAIGLCTLYLVPATLANWPAPPWLITITTLLAGFSVALALRWALKVRRARAWDVSAQLLWQQFEAARLAGGTTTEVTVLSVQEVQPTGAWVTINWDQFGYTQPAWIEGRGGTYWPGSVVLITPDPMQVHVGQPWPPTYRIAENDCRAIAPLLR